MPNGWRTPWPTRWADAGTAFHPECFNIMNTPQKPKDPPAKPPLAPEDNGIPEGAEEHDPKGLPDSGRHESETAAER